MIPFLRKYHLRVYSVVVAAVILAAHYEAALPVDLILAVAAAALGESAQRVSTSKIAEALYTPVPEDGA